ncbi:hypothetical protein K32_11420 [Kaistia sp. 32K]|uniref:DUF6101 family protein n=1 Tax=Kaistia sp. 32K TaxID=2795690 RepID=UPI001915BE9E|nr:DUF6101 family protein [Kaistia sp. 32K]BCP52525.1 hypothetical protein K32_11420 [Kaistia sp. 32K]
MAQASGNDLRLDPFALPVRYEATLAGPASATTPAVYLDREQAIIKRRLGGIPTTLSTPVSAFRGVAVRMSGDPETGAVRTIVELMHRDPAMSLPLVVVEDLGNGEDVAADWQAWGRALGLPLLIVDGDGTVRAPLEQLGSLVVGDPKARRAPASITRRRPRFLKRRKTGFYNEVETLSGREIIARD